MVTTCTHYALCPHCGKVCTDTTTTVEGFEIDGCAEWVNSVNAKLALLAA